MRAALWSLVLVTCLTAVVSTPGQAEDVLATGTLRIEGTRLWLYANGSENDAEQELNVGEPGRIRTCFGATSQPCGSVAAGDPRVAGLVVLAELSGPELTEPLSLQTVPGGSFLLPGFQQAGDYLLQNIRLVDSENKRVVGVCEPAVAVVHVYQFMLTSTTVQTLSLAALQAKGYEVEAPE